MLSSTQAVLLSIKYLLSRQVRNQLPIESEKPITNRERETIFAVAAVGRLAVMVLRNGQMALLLLYCVVPQMVNKNPNIFAFELMVWTTIGGAGWEGKCQWVLLERANVRRRVQKTSIWAAKWEAGCIRDDKDMSEDVR